MPLEDPVSKSDTSVFEDPEGAKQLMFNLLRHAIWNIHISLPNAGPALVRSSHESVDKFIGCISELLVCAIRPDDRIFGLTREVLRVYKSYLESPHTNAAAIGQALINVMSDIKDTLLKMIMKAGSSSGIQNEKKRSLATHTYSDALEEQRAVVLAISIVSDAVALIEQLIGDVSFKDDACIPGTVVRMEGQLKKSMDLRDHIVEMIDCLFPLGDVREILKCLDSMEALVDDWEHKLRPCGSIFEEFVLKSCVLKDSIRELKSIYRSDADCTSP